MNSQFEFLNKHHCATDLAQVAAQAALERYGHYPRMRTAVVVYAVDWTLWTESIAQAVRAYSDRNAHSPGAQAMLDPNGQQWRITLTGLRYVSAGRISDGGGTVYRVHDYRDASAQVTANAVGHPPQLGEVVRFEQMFGTLAGPVELPKP